MVNEIEEISRRLRKKREDSKNPSKVENGLKITEINLSFGNVFSLTAKFALAGIIIGIILYFIMQSSLFGLLQLN
ncbi:MAG: hypothetical protein CMD58_02145 [Gammaproteobacteria bacterium]|mgnify:CR=1 FL=1|nr:hypothetical protein [Gammaproteobacteria bacterium]|tara:strand:- start:826 stop:1050 length:225 start_codon:yes stop_codon:yes gene_type:complete